MGKRDDLAERVSQFNALQLPGQPMAVHMGTSYLVGDLWKEARKVPDLLEALEECVRQMGMAPMKTKGGVDAEIAGRAAIARARGESNWYTEEDAS